MILNLDTLELIGRMFLACACGIVIGLTTAAGVWAVSGIGMAVGAGMYIIGITATLMVLMLQIILHTKSVLASKYKTIKNENTQC